MPYVMNALQDPVSVQVFGNWYTIAPGQIKAMSNEKVAYKMVTDLAYRGLVEIPESVMEDRNSPESKAIIAEKKKVGIINRMNKLKEIWDNLDVALRQDLQQQGMNADPYSFASTGELNALKEMKLYKDFTAGEDVDKIETIRKLKEEVNGLTNTAHSGTPVAGNPNNARTTSRRE